MAADFFKWLTSLGIGVRGVDVSETGLKSKWINTAVDASFGRITQLP